MDIPGLRNILGQMYKRLVRNKVLQPMRGHRLAVVDGHEINSSYKRCCEQCLQRRITINGEEQIQYYHRAVIFMLIGPACFFLLDFELLNPGDDEGTAAMRLIDRVLKHYPRSFDILLGDGLYPQARIFKKLRQHGKHAIVVLKDERRDLMKDSRSLFKSTPTLKYQEKSILYQCWDIENLDSWDSYDEKVRLLRTLETKIIRKKHGHRKMKEEQTTEWVWITTLPASVVPAKNVVCFGHERWRIENEGFNELNNHWNAKHYFHHHPVSIQAFWLILFIAHTLFHCFMRNLKPALRYGHSLLHWADLIRAEFITNKWAFSTA